ncbi:hypothetical protein CR513_55858, partial [Mucuna pruriens]
RRKALKFEASDHIFLRVTLVIRVGHVITFRKLSLKFLGPYHILSCTYLLYLSNIHNVFHVLIEKIHQISHTCQELDSIQIREDLTFEAQLAKDEATRDSTWELENKMRRALGLLGKSLFSRLLLRREPLSLDETQEQMNMMKARKTRFTTNAGLVEAGQYSFGDRDKHRGNLGQISQGHAKSHVEPGVQNTDLDNE